MKGGIMGSGSGRVVYVVLALALELLEHLRSIRFGGLVRHREENSMGGEALFLCPFRPFVK